MAAKPKKTTAKPPKKAKPAKPAKTGKKFNSPVNEEDRALFLQTLPKIAELKSKLATANSNLRLAYKTAKKDGFAKEDFEVAFQIQSPEGEKARKAAIARNLTIAKWLGCDLGSQLDLFVQDERVPAVDRAYDEGKTASMQGESAKPSYDPSTPQHASYMQGFHDDQEKRIKAGIKKAVEGDDEAQKKGGVTPGLITEAQKKAAAGKETPAPAKKGNGALPQSGIPVSRAAYNALKEAQQAEEADKPLFEKA